MKIVHQLGDALQRRKRLSPAHRRRLPPTASDSRTEASDTAPAAPIVLPPTALPPATLQEALRCLPPDRSALVLGPPGVGKSSIVEALARSLRLRFTAIQAPQMLPEDLLGVMRIDGGFARWSPPYEIVGPRGPVCLLVDELAGASPETQRSLHELILSHRIGAHRLPAGSRVVAAGNNTDDLAWARRLSSALVNRVLVLNLRVEPSDWLRWAARHRVIREVRNFVRLRPAALLRRPDPDRPGPFSSPRSWTSFSRDLEAARRASCESLLVAAFAEGNLSPADAREFVACLPEGLADALAPGAYLTAPLPAGRAMRALVVDGVRSALGSATLPRRSAAALFDGLAPGGAGSAGGRPRRGVGRIRRHRRA
jgi:hypothetical protein